MNNLSLKTWLKLNFYLSNKILSKRITEKWFSLSNNLKEYSLILESTSFLKDVKLSERIYCILNNIKKNPICKLSNCTNITRFAQFSIGYSNYCSTKCANLDPETQKKIEIKCLKKFGTRRASQSDKVKRKVRKTNLKKFGVENPFQSEKIKDKIKQTLINNLGVDNPQKSNIIKNKSRKTCIVKYGTEYKSQQHIKIKNLNKLKDKNFLINLHHNERITLTKIATILGVTPKTVCNYFAKHDIKTFNYPSSSYEKEIIEFLDQENIEINSRKIIVPYELDIYLPNNKLAIEFNGMFWHSFNKKETPKEKRKHLLKIEMCEELGIQLFNIFENELVSLIIFSELKKHYYKITRHCDKNGIDIIGGASKIFKYFIDNYYQKSIISRVDRRSSDGSLYKKLGFKHLYNSNINYYYFKNKRFLYPKEKFQKHKLHEQLKIFDPKLTDYQNMFNNNYRRIWDCGSSIFSWNK